MTKSGFSPNNHTLPFVLKACCSTTFRSLTCCKQLHTHVIKFGLHLDSHVANALIRAYSISHVLNDARNVFDQLTHRSLTLWTTMISGYAQNLCAGEALMLFDRMVLEGFVPNSVTLASVLSACAQSGGLELGERLHVYIENRGLEMGVILGTALVHMYAKNGAILEARKVFDSMSDRNTATWNAMICGSASHGHAEEALSLFREIEKEQIVPNDITFVGVLSACCHAGLIGTGREIFSSMKSVYGVEPKIEHYGCMVDLLGRGGMIEEAEKLIKGMVWKADMVMLGALLAACRTYGNIEVAERLVEQMVALEPNNHGVYVVLSNIYAEAGRWEDVRRLRKVMRVENLKKTPGWSLVDGHK